MPMGRVREEHSGRVTPHIRRPGVRPRQDNPQLVKFIESQVGKYPRELHNAMFEAVMGAISVFEHQAMVDNKETNVINMPKGKSQ